MFSEPLAARAIQRVRRRLIPFLALLYFIAYLDRVNVGFAALQMNTALGFSSSVFGKGAGIFFIGYFLFEVPSNLILARVGARIWIARIAILWGFVSISMMFIKGASSFYLVRFLLGAAEAGFFPGMILYLTYWFPAAEQARAVARFMTATAIAGLVGGPISGKILEQLGGLGGLAGWQWLFLLEGLPAVGFGLVALGYLTDRPADADWLAPAERAWLTERMRREHAERSERHGYSVMQALVHGRVWLLALLYFALVCGLYGVSFWIPQIIQGFGGLGDFAVGVVSMVPYLAAAIGMVIVGAHSDRRQERRWHLAGPAFVGAAGLVVSGSVMSPFVSLLALSLGALGMWSALGPFWARSATFASGSAAAGAIALVNSVGNLGGFLGPFLVGLVKEHTDGFAGGLAVLAGWLVLAGVIALGLRDEAAPPA
jgi:ACS family tartrate transporter-like MFS transporter